MPLDIATADTKIQSWLGTVPTDWSDADAGRIREALIRLSAALTPVIVDAASMTPEKEQEYLLTRTVDELTRWLTRAASGLRHGQRLGAQRLRADNQALALGLRAASVKELEALPLVGPKGAAAIARMVRLHPDLVDVDDLLALDEVGEAALEMLRQETYLDSPSVVLTSGSLTAFASRPSVETFLRVLATSDLELVVGDETSLQRKGITGGTQTDRFLRFITVATENAVITVSPASGALASDASLLVARRKLRQERLAEITPAEGEILAGADYVSAANELITGAQSEISLMMFLGTAAAGDNLGPGPLELIEALEARAADGLAVRVLLDQDDGGEPYRSVFINQPLVDRLRAKNIEVKFDDKDTLLHSKVLVVDGEAVIVGSHNWTRAAFREAQELSVLVRSAPVAAAYAARFQALWDTLQ